LCKYNTISVRPKAVDGHLNLQHRTKTGKLENIDSHIDMQMGTPATATDITAAYGYAEYGP